MDEMQKVRLQPEPGNARHPSLLQGSFLGPVAEQGCILSSPDSYPFHSTNIKCSLCTRLCLSSEARP